MKFNETHRTQATPELLQPMTLGEKQTVMQGLGLLVYEKMSF